MRLQGVKIIGYHGTASENVESILQNNYNLSGEKEWFGKGIYFFADCSPLTDGFVEARDWVIHVKRFEKWAIFRAELESKKSLDIVNDLAHKKIFKEIQEKLLSLHLESGRTKESFSDKVVFKKLELQAKFDLIRCAVTPEKSRVSFVVSRIQIQVCVKDKNCIKKMNDKLFEKMSNENAPAILLPFARAIITSFTAQANIPPIILPLVNLTKSKE